LSSGLIGGLTAAICVPIAFALLRRLKAYNRLEKSGLSIEELRARYGRWDLISRIIGIPLMFSLAYVCWILLCWIEAIRASFLGPANFVLTPIPIFFGIPSLFAGILLTAVTYKLIFSSILGSDGYMRLIQYQSLKQKINSAKVLRHMTFVLVPAIVVSVVLGFQTYAVATDWNLVFHPYFSIMERTYGWNEIYKVALVKSFRAPNGNLRRDRPFYSVHMTDGGELNFHRTLLEIPIKDQEAFASFVAAHAHVIVEIEDPFPTLR